MSLFKKKENQRDKSIYMPIKARSSKYPKRRKTRINIFKKDKSLRKGRPKIAKYILLFLLPVLFITIIFFSIKFVNNIRSSDNEDVYSVGSVLGLTDIPVYQYSIFIFENSLDQPSVSKFLSEGNSAYRLLANKKIDDVFKYYKEKLPPLGWENILNVPLGSEEQKYGQYWIKEDKGLRIYSKFNDIWYESVTKEDAQTGLAELVKKETERNLLLIDTDAQDLLPDFPWIIKIPKDYIISYSTGTFENFSSVIFKKLGTNESTSIIPVGKRGDKALDYFLYDYIKILNKDGKKWVVKNTFVSNTNIGAGLKGTIGNNDEIHDVAVLHNTYNSVVYIVDCNVVKNPFFTYIIENIQIQEKIRY
ncbi:MAG: hypothetical protein PHE21_02230 [Candidatus Dojkabacteria bacterium]|nr:hypothetical protein [Candidatus Dojkabacteria bacterium]